MAFLLYAITDRRYQRRFELEGKTSLWGVNGLVAQAAKPKVASGGAWTVAAEELLVLLNEGSGNAILDDLVPNGPEVRMGRIGEIRGYLDPPIGSDSNDRYNPILITMEEVLSLPPGTPSDERIRLKESIALPDTPGRTIRSINYLVKSWKPPRGFGGALLWDRHWDSLISEGLGSE